MTTWATDTILCYALVRSLTHMLIKRIYMPDAIVDDDFVLTKSLMDRMITARVEDLRELGAGAVAHDVLEEAKG